MQRAVYVVLSSTVLRCMACTGFGQTSPGAIEELREVWYNFLWHEDVATPGGAALRKMWRSRVSLMQ
jgi:hypothetical protein